MSERRENRRRELMQRLRYVLGEERWLKMLEMIESGELEKQRRHLFEVLESDEAERHLKPFEISKDFLRYSN